jgi:asparagine synthase (glutamine-hydrolysing)
MNGRSASSRPVDGFCGWAAWETSPAAARDALGSMSGRLLPGAAGAPAACATGLGRSSAVAAVGRHAAPTIFEDGRFWVLIQGEIRFGATNGRDTERTAEPHEILDAYRERGERALESMRGAFALAIVSREGDECLLAIDRIGGRFPLAYRAEGGALVFATVPAAIPAHPRGRADVDPQGVYDYLYFHIIPAPRSIRRGVRRLEPAGWVRRSGGELYQGTYWHPSYRDDDRARLPELCEEFRELLRRGVERYARGVSVGCFLSGGTDSSSVAGYLGRSTGAPARTYSIGFAAQGFDEMEYARTAASAFGTDHHEYYVTPKDVLEGVPRAAAAYSEPFGNASAVPTLYCARLAASDGVERLLGGDGGDELFGGNTRYATQRVFGLYERVPRPARHALERVLPAVPGDIAPIRKIRSYVAQARLPMPQRLHTYNMFERDGAGTILHPDLLSAVDLGEPMRLQERAYGGAQARTMLNRMLALDLKFTLADNDLPKVGRMCELAGLDVAYPFLTDEMIEFSFRVPARLKLKGFKLRWFMKHALRDFLPRPILTKKKHGFGLPFGMWMKDDGALESFARDNLERLKRRGLVRQDYVDETVRLHRRDHATYYGGTIWMLVMLEQWFEHHEDRAPSG